MEVAREPSTRPDDYDALLAEVRDAMLSGRKPPAVPRSVIANSWQRVRRMGVPVGAEASRRAVAATGVPLQEQAGPVDAAALAEGRIPLPPDLSLTAFVPLLERELQPLLDDNVMLLVLSDAHGRIVWREGGRGLSEDAERLGFRVGDAWTERTVGTNAVGTSLVERQPVQVHGAEHYCQAQQRWSCAGAPVIDVRTGLPLGVIDLSTATEKAHPAMLSLASSLASEIQFAIRQAHMSALDQLRAGNWVGASRLPNPWLIVDRFGWVALSNGLVPPRVVSLPAEPASDAVIPELGVVRIAPVPGGYLLECVDRADDLRPTLTLSRARNGDATMTVRRGEASWLHRLTPRQATIARYLAEHPGGSTAAEIARAIYGSDRSEVSVRAEISRMKQAVGAFLTPRPYRFTADVIVEDDLVA